MREKARSCPVARTCVRQVAPVATRHAAARLSERASVGPSAEANTEDSTRGNEAMLDSADMVISIPKTKTMVSLINFSASAVSAKTQKLTSLIKLAASAASQNLQDLKSRLL